MRADRANRLIPLVGPLIEARGPDRSRVLSYASIGLLILALGIALSVGSQQFDVDSTLADMPVLAFVAGYMVAGVIFLALPAVIPGCADLAPEARRRLAVLMVIAGLAMRLVMLPSQPVLENDYQRYLWDGAVVAHGMSPYAAAPAAAKQAGPETPLGRLAAQSGDVLDRISYPHLRSIYPPVAELAFAAAHLVGPFSLTAWRLFALVLDGLSLWLLLGLLAATGRSALWATLYWWNPIVIKELHNSAHSEVVLVPLLLAALLLAVRQKPALGSVALSLAAGVKLWPVLLLPLMLRHCTGDRRRLLLSASVFAAVTAAWAVPYALANLGGESSGLLAYAEKWKTFSALFPVLEGLAAGMAGLFAFVPAAAGVLARGLIGVALVGLAVWLARRPVADADDLLRRVAMLATAMLLVSPSQFPWYAVWCLPFLPFAPLLALRALAITLPLYYTAFYFIGQGQRPVFDQVIVWIAWLPIWGLLAFELTRGRLWGEPDPERRGG